ncbi:MAG: type IV pilus assembly protein PilM [Candidatus Omnitrophica bacterium]|nr:type IV pilus assembly protein PilM [Candidatus Omnitrophota bacterium]
MHYILESYFNFIKRTVLSQGDDNVLGLDMGATICSAVELRRGQSSFEVVRWATEVVDSTDEKISLNKLLDKMGPSARTKPCIVAVGGKGTLIRHIDMPRMTVADLRKAFAIEADKYFPFPKETVYSDCFILDPRAKDKRMAVLVAAIKKDVVDLRLKVLKECGITPEALTVSSSAVANAFATFAPPTCTPADLGAKAVAVIDIGETFTNLMIISDGVPRFTRDIFIGATDVWRRMANVTGLSVAEVKTLYLKATTGLADLLPAKDYSEDMRRSVDAVLGNVVAEIKLSFDYFNTEKNMPVGRICLIGEGVFVPDVEAAFMAHFDIPSIAWNPADMLAVAADANRDGFVSEGRRMTIALGLALSHYD